MKASYRGAGPPEHALLVGEVAKLSRIGSI